MALARLGHGDEAMELFHMINPINQARSSADVSRYKTEPYAVPGDVYAHPQHAGRGGWTWYTGSAGWMYRAGLEEILGLRRTGSTLSIRPCIPATWPAYSVSWRFGRTRYEISVTNPEHRSGGIVEAELDGNAYDPESIPLVDDGGVHEVKLVMGVPRREHAHEWGVGES
jgi:cyclic beta-1,2-glucan synthetase